jgi:erythromycin esterase
MEDIVTYIQEIDPSNLGMVQDNLECFSKHVINYSANHGAELYSQAGSDIQAGCRQGLQAISDMFRNNQATYETASSPARFTEMFAEVRLLIQNEQLMAVPDMIASINLRDQYMAENVAWLFEQAEPESKMVIWAHNGHVTDARGQWTEAEATAFGGTAGQETIPMGAHLRALYGNQLVVVGFAFNQGSFLAIGFSERTNSALGYGVFNLVGPLPGSHEEYMATASLPRLMLDLRQVPNNPELANWFGQARWMTVFGMGYVTDNPQANATKIILPEAFDILIFFHTTTAAQR